MDEEKSFDRDYSDECNDPLCPCHSTKHSQDETVDEKKIRKESRHFANELKSSIISEHTNRIKEGVEKMRKEHQEVRDDLKSNVQVVAYASGQEDGWNACISRVLSMLKDTEV